MPTPLLTALVVIANVMGVGMTVPQVVRLHRTRATAGVSGAWVGLGIGMNAWWFAYAWAEHLVGLIPVSVGALVLYTVIAAQYIGLERGQGLRRLAVGILGFATIASAALLSAGWSAVGLSLGVTYAVQFTPAVLAALRTHDLGGISPVTWRMALVEAAIWFLYGAVVDDVALLVGGGGGAVMSGAILARLWLVSRPEVRVAT